MVLRRETGWAKNPSRGELEWGIGRIRGGLKIRPTGGRGGGGRVGGCGYFEKPLELYCTLFLMVPSPRSHTPCTDFTHEVQAVRIMHLSLFSPRKVRGGEGRGMWMVGIPWIRHLQKSMTHGRDIRHLKGKF